MKYKRADISRMRYCTKQGLDPVFLERWAAAFNLARTIPDDQRFFMGSFGERADTPCGTAACLAGHAMLHPWFRDGGLEPGSRSRSEFGLIFTEKGEKFFGLLDGWGSSPFSSDWSHYVTGYRRLTPILMSEVVMAWMLSHWEKGLVKAAVQETKDVQYDAKWVHRFTPWRGAKPGEEIPKAPPEEEVKNA